MSRRKEIEKAAVYLGLYAAHEACYGPGWREVGHYWGQTSRRLLEIRMNHQEIEYCRHIATERAIKYIDKAYADPSKVGLPANKDTTIRMAIDSIARALRELQER